MHSRVLDCLLAFLQIAAKPETEELRCVATRKPGNGVLWMPLAEPGLSTLLIVLARS